MGKKNHSERNRLLSPDYLRYMGTDWEYLRNSVNITRSDLAKAIGVSRPTIQHLEQHVGSPHLSTVQKLIKFWEKQGIVIPRFELKQVNKSKFL